MPLMAVLACISRHLSASHPLRPNVTSSIKLEVHNIAQCRRRRTEPRPQGIRTQDVVPIGPAVPEICLWTERYTDRQTDIQTGRSQYSASVPGRTNNSQYTARITTYAIRNMSLSKSFR